MILGSKPSLKTTAFCTGFKRNKTFNNLFVFITLCLFMFSWDSSNYQPFEPPELDFGGSRCMLWLVQRLLPEAMVKCVWPIWGSFLKGSQGENRKNDWILLEGKEYRSLIRKTNLLDIVNSCLNSHLKQRCCILRGFASEPTPLVQGGKWTINARQP